MDSEKRYELSFGQLPNKTCYADSGNFQTGDLRPGFKSLIDNNIKINKKALETTTGGAGTAGNALVPVYVDPQIIDISRKQTPLVELIPRVSNMGMTADYNRITAKGAAVALPEDAPLTEADDTYERQSKPIKSLYSVGRVTGQAQAAIPSYMLPNRVPNGAVGPFSSENAGNAMQLEILTKARALKELEENLIVNGSIASDANEFDGIVVQMGATNTVDKNTTALDLDDIDDAIQLAFDNGGTPSLAVCSSGVYTDLQKLLTAKIGYLQSSDQVFWGFSTIVLNTAVGRVPVIQSRFLSNTSGSKAMYFLDMSVVEMRVLQDMTYERMAKVNDSEKFFMKIYEVFLIKAPEFCASITEISA